MAQNDLEKGMLHISRQLTTNDGGMSWIVIIVLFIVFWPAGVFFLMRKLTVNRMAQLNDGKAMRYAGIALILIGAGALLNGAYGAVFYFIGGIALFYMGNNMKQTSQRYRRYIGLVANEQIREIDVMASIVGVDPDTCTKDLQKMIEKNFFHNAFIDYAARRLVIQERVYETQPLQPAYSGAGGAQVQSGPRVVRCPSCGANNTVMGSTSECEYCGSPLS